MRPLARRLLVVLLVVLASSFPAHPALAAGDCDKAIKLLTQYERLAAKYNVTIPPKRLQEMNRKRDDGTITSYDLPGTMQREFPGPLVGKSLRDIRAACKATRRQPPWDRR